ncbi:hypothetical protein Slala02_65440 [Streptomyces lavendulae subsp. lavendulae]|nr:hypothetical protein Slala01_69050 [Streptomyces lavendulae subsp. lavendulae]GLX30724.1 hypothetical protein Slala02_65440 [Streptomyces lavendulae subsp. lavendulae]
MVREVLEDLAQPGVAGGRQPGQRAVEGARVGPEQARGRGAGGSSRRTPSGMVPDIGSPRCCSGKAIHFQIPNGSGTGYADAAGPAGLQGSPVCGWVGTRTISASVPGAGSPGPASTARRAGRSAGSRASRARRNASAARPSGTVTGRPAAAASRWARARPAAASHCGLHDHQWSSSHTAAHLAIGSTGGVALVSSSSSAQEETAGPASSAVATGRRSTASGASQTACQSEQSSIRLATGRPHASQAMLGPSPQSRPQQ